MKTAAGLAAPRVTDEVFSVSQGRVCKLLTCNVRRLFISLGSTGAGSDHSYSCLWSKPRTTIPIAKSEWKPLTNSHNDFKNNEPITMAVLGPSCEPYK